MTYGSVGRYRVLEFIRSFVEEAGYAPTYREICKGIGLSAQATVYEHVKRLKAEGFLRGNGHRQIALVKGICPSCKRPFPRKSH